MKEAFDDYKRMVRDRETNLQTYPVWMGGGFNETPSENLVPGQMLELKANDRVPADCVLLWSGDPSETVFVKTD